jgi:hypothetical protein
MTLVRWQEAMRFALQQLFQHV